MMHMIPGETLSVLQAAPLSKHAVQFFCAVGFCSARTRAPKRLADDEVCTGYLLQLYGTCPTRASNATF
jgi:hypothetical protein